MIPDHYRIQSAVIPVRRRVDGRLEVLLVTSRSKKRWVPPKGIVETGLSPEVSAAKEAWEEAGVRGRVHEESLGSFEHRKWGGVCSVEVFVLEVDDESPRWPEELRRTRRWLTVEDAAQRVESEELKAIIRRTPSWLETRPPATWRENGLSTMEHKKRRLILLRHAKSSWKDISVADFDRGLNKRGKDNAPMMGERLLQRGIDPNLIISSPARRARKTITAVAKTLAYPSDEIEYDGDIYEASLGELLSVVRGIEEHYFEVILVGHNPGFTELANFLADGSHIDNIPTCGAVCLEFDTHHWSLVDGGDGKLVFFDYPKKDG